MCALFYKVKPNHEYQNNMLNSSKLYPHHLVIEFGKHFTDHMFNMDYNKSTGWNNPQIVPFDGLSISPSTSVFHYAQSVFEGLKACLNEKGEIVLFRPYENAK